MADIEKIQTILKQRGLDVEGIVAHDHLKNVLQHCDAKYWNDERVTRVFERSNLCTEGAIKPADFLKRLSLADDAAQPKQVCVCGGGHAAHVMAVLIPALLPDCRVHILTTSGDKAERWSNTISEQGPMTLTKSEPDGSKRTLKGTPTLVTNDPAKAVPSSDVVFMCLASVAHQSYLEAIEPHVRPGATIVGMPMYPGFTWLLNKVFGPTKAKTVKVVGFDTLPWAARLQSYGASAEVVGTKSQVLACCSDKSSLQMVKACIGKYPEIRVGSGISVDLMTTNPYIHLSIMYAKWRQWDGKGFDEEPLFYQGCDAFAAETMAAMNDEVVIEAKSAIQKLRPSLDLSKVVSVHQWYIDCYFSQTEDASSLQMCLNTNAGYHGLKHPCIKHDDGKFMPDFKHRYMTEDLPMGLVPLRAIAHMLGVATPVTDKVILWCQRVVGKEYLKDGVLNGKDIGETRAPGNYGITTIEEMLSISREGSSHAISRSHAHGGS